MTNAISRLHKALETWSFNYNCYEAVHPWTPFCSDSAVDIGLTVFTEAFKLYTPLYLFSQVMQRKYDYDSSKNTFLSIVRSTTFISANAFFALFFFCSSQYLTGKFYYYAVAYIPGFLASAMAVLIEKPSRRSSLAFYVANVASETLFRIYVARGYVRPLKYGQVYLFTLSIATLMLLAKKYGFEDDPLSSAIKLIVGPEEATRRQKRQRPQSSATAIIEEKDEVALISSSSSSKHNSSTTSTNNLVEWIKTHNLIVPRNSTSFLTVRSPLCPHKDCSCVHYVTKASLRAFLIGYGAQLALRLSTKAHLIIRDPTIVRSLASDTGIFGFGLFLASFSGLFKTINCMLRWTTKTSTPINSFLAGLIAGPALLFYPSPTVALYVLWKCLEALFNEAVDQGVIVRKDLYIVLLYGLATSQLFYSALMNPQHMKKSYMSFLDRISHHKLHMINRSVLDVFGTEASTGYEEFFPDLHPKFMSRAFLGSVWLWMLEQKFTVNQISQISM